MVHAPLLSLLTFVLTSTPEDWPAWRGPHGDGTVAGSPPTEWSEQKNVRWRVELIGAGLSQPIVFGERVVLTSAVPTGKTRPGVREGITREPIEIPEQEFFVCTYARASGKELWRKKVARAMPHEATHPTNTYATPTPASDGERLYCSFGSFGLYALTQSGDVVWQVDLGDLEMRGHGEGSSPLLHDGGLFVLWAHGGASFLCRLEAASGKELWRTSVPEGNNCTTPIVIHAGGRDAILVSGRYVIACDSQTGHELWRFGDFASDGITSMASPVVYDDLVVVPGVNRRDLRVLIIPGEAGEAEVLWSRRSNDNIPSPLVHDGRVYYVRGDSGQLVAFDGVTGEDAFGPERIEGITQVWASPVLAGKRLYVVGRDGTSAVFELGETPKLLARNTLDDQFDASPAVAGSELYLRGKKRLYCLSAK